MAEDSRDYIERTLSRSRDYDGREMTPAEMATTFARCDVHARVSALEEIKHTQGEPRSLREAAKRLNYARVLRNTHEVLRRVNR